MKSKLSVDGVSDAEVWLSLFAVAILVSNPAFSPCGSDVCCLVCIFFQLVTFSFKIPCFIFKQMSTVLALTLPLHM